MKSFGNIFKIKVERQLQTSGASSMLSLWKPFLFYSLNILIMSVLRSNTYIIYLKKIRIYIISSLLLSSLFPPTIHSNYPFQGLKFCYTNQFCYSEQSTYPRTQNTGPFFSHICVRIKLGYNSSEREILI